MGIEQQEKWEPVEGIVTPAASALIHEDNEGLVVTLLFSDVIDGRTSDLCMKFGRVRAYTVYEEFLHPWNRLQKEFPRLTGKWENYTYPLLLIQDSEWVSWLSDLIIIPPSPIQYRFVTLDRIVDVLCNRSPEMTWVNRLKS
ncbi:MAG: hypothetical protein QOH71_559 [Blastocatellia bacterium]|jgi:hypothetical protein|nr:hypothetical protein [Blastocatellia bacterium]